MGLCSLVFEHQQCGVSWNHLNRVGGFHMNHATVKCTWVMYGVGLELVSCTWNKGKEMEENKRKHWTHLARWSLFLGKGGCQETLETLYIKKMDDRQETLYVILRDFTWFTWFCEKWIYVILRDLRDFTWHVKAKNPGRPMRFFCQCTLPCRCPVTSNILSSDWRGGGCPPTERSVSRHKGFLRPKITMKFLFYGAARRERGGLQ